MSVARKWTCLVMLAGLWACRQPNPDWLGPAGAATTMDATTTMGATMDGSASDGTSSTGPDPTDGATTIEPIPMQCAPEPVLGEGECPAPCTSCDGGRCLVDCSVADCKNTKVVCPEGWPCDLVCTTDSACKGSDLTCASERDCTLACDGMGACQNATLVCGAGACAVTCGTQTDVCRRLEVVCGPADTTITCASASNADVVPGTSSRCACTTLGCAG